MWRLFDWSEHSFWEIKGTGLYPLCWNMQRLFDWTFLLKNQRYWTHNLCWNIQRLFDWSEHFIWEIRKTELTCYVETCKDDLTNENISFEKSEALLDSHAMLEHAKIIWLNIPFEKSEVLDSQAILEHAKIIWLIRTFLLRNQSH